MLHQLLLESVDVAAGKWRSQTKGLRENSSIQKKVVERKAINS
jgi:hypothetical protein